ncbi:MAG: DinB family protein [Acidobacteria bacterium]|nr:DinB family protein [Acidobacteriota bacterium]
MREVSERLRRVIAEAEPKLRGTTEEDSGKAALKGGWSRKQVIGHLIDSAANNHQRFVRAALQGSYEGPGYAQDDWVSLQDYQGRKWAELLAFWSAYNRHLAHVIAQLPEDQAGAVCTIGAGEPHTLEWLATDYVDHLVGHLRQIGVA